MSGRRRRAAVFFAVAFLVVALVAGVASRFASSSPDGLESVAGTLGFIDAAEPHPLADSPLADYAVAGVGDAGLATGLAGLAGVLAVLGLSMLVGIAVRRPQRERPR